MLWCPIVVARGRGWILNTSADVLFVNFAVSERKCLLLLFSNGLYIINNKSKSKWKQEIKHALHKKIKNAVSACPAAESDKPKTSRSAVLMRMHKIFLLQNKCRVGKVCINRCPAVDLSNFLSQNISTR